MENYKVENWYVASMWRIQNDAKIITYSFRTVRMFMVQVLED